MARDAQDGYVVRDKRRTESDDAASPTPKEMREGRPSPTASGTPIGDPALLGTTPRSQAADVSKLHEQLKAAEERYLRAVADVDNTKKRLQREKDEFAKYATEAIIRDMLPILDGLDQALVAVDKQSDPQAVITGVHLIYRQLLGVLEKEGVKRIATIGERFDPHVHEAVAHVPADAQHPDGTIVEEVHVGYTMHGQVIRSAMVKVATNTADSG